MILKVFNKEKQLIICESFKEKEIIIGRNPSVQPSLIIDSQTISRNHAKIIIKNDKIYITDLNSSNGTFLKNTIVKPQQLIQVTQDDQVGLAEFQGFLKIQIRNKEQTKNKKQTAYEERQRSRQKNECPLKLSESTLKMLREMTANRKSKEQKIKFLKLMGYGKAEQYWETIQQLIKQKKSQVTNKKASQELEKQFNLGRSNAQKKGLGK